MKKALILLFLISVLLLFGVQCTFLERHFRDPYILDLDGIKARGTLRTAVDNNSTSYYIYRGRRMGYEFELLRDLGKRLEVQIEFVVVSDIDQAFEYLAEGKVDLIAMNLEQNEERSELVNFTQSLGPMSTVLVGMSAKPSSWAEIGSDTIFVRKGTVYEGQLEKVRDSLDLDFVIMESPEHEETLIDLVSDGEIKWTVADKNIAQANKTYYEGLDISNLVAQEGSVAWAVRQNSPNLLQEIDTWILEKKKRFIPDLYTKYFLTPKNNFYRTNSSFSSLGGNRISVYDDIMKESAKELGWDWRLLAALVYKESGFDTTALSYAGAEGLLQLMPVTLERFGVTNPNDPVQSLKGGVKYLQYLDKFWIERVPETNERVKFVLASYNIGQGHVEDAWRLTLKYGKNTQTWSEVAFYLSLKSDPEYYRDPVVKSGFAKGHIAVNYVRDVLGLFKSYKTLVNP
ncbi:MAG: transporter substrate-binding domain-containing protein [Algoriphagus sp.]|jgi:membrane-bound lytic murein transglycosylase F|nr:transporter substrate-binding domain-containing protein [Algoriphagus sp.]